MNRLVNKFQNLRNSAIFIRKTDESKVKPSAPQSKSNLA